MWERPSKTPSFGSMILLVSLPAAFLWGMVAYQAAAHGPAVELALSVGAAVWSSIILVTGVFRAALAETKE